MLNDKHIQKAGDYSQQCYINNLTIENGITEQRARELYSELSSRAIESCTSEATEIAINRINEFENTLIPRIEKIESDFKSFADPSFQFLLKSAQKTAACSGQSLDYEILSELLAYRIQRGTERKVSASISKAVEIVDQIDDAALCGLTLLHALTYLYPTSGYIAEGLNVLENLYSKLIYMELPVGDEWIEHLEVLGAVKTMPFSFIKEDFSKLINKRLSGYVCAGIDKSSNDYQKAKEILLQAKVSHNMLIDNELIDGYVRLSLPHKEHIERQEVLEQFITKEMKETVIKAVSEVFSLYCNNDIKNQQAKNVFLQKWDCHNNLKKLREWWDHNSSYVTVTPVGRVLAHANAQRCDSRIPDYR